MDPWSDAKKIVLEEEAKTRSETVLAYGLLDQRELLDPQPASIQGKVLQKPQIPFLKLHRQRELGKTTYSPAKEAIILNIRQNFNLREDKPLSVINSEIKQLKLKTCQSRHYVTSYTRVRRVHQVLQAVEHPDKNTNTNGDTGQSDANQTSF